MSKEIIIPQRRFKDFKNALGWEATNLGSVLKGQSSSMALNKLQFVDKGYPVYGADGLMGLIDTYVQDEDYIAIIKDGSGVGKLFLYDKQSSILGTLSYLKSKDNQLFYLKYLFYLLQTIDLSSYIKGSGIPHIYYSDYAKQVVAIPQFIEQQKIADCLSSLDDLITAENQQLEALKAHKKGLMQQLFPSEGETMPKLRFEEFRDSGKWEDKALGQCLLRHPEYGINASAVPYSDNLPKYLRITDISEDGLYLNDGKVSVGKEVTEANYLQEGDIVLARTGASVGKSYKYKVEDGELVFAGFLIRVRPDTNNINPELLFQHFSSEQYWRWVKFISARSGQPGINGNEFSSMPIYLPKSLQEQQKIASCLSSLDDLITAQTEKIEGLKVHKKGLMQGLFPAVI